MNFNSAIILTTFLASTVSCSFAFSCETYSDAAAEKYREDTQVFKDNLHKIWRCGRRYWFAPQYWRSYLDCIAKIGLTDLYHNQVLNLDPCIFNDKNEFRKNIEILSKQACLLTYNSFRDAEYNRSTVYISPVQIGWLYKDPAETDEEMMINLELNVDLMTNKNEAVSNKFVKESMIVLDSLNRIWACGNRYKSALDYDRSRYELCIEQIGLTDLYKANIMNLDTNHFGSLSSLKSAIELMFMNANYEIMRNFRNISWRDSTKLTSEILNFGLEAPEYSEEELNSYLLEKANASQRFQHYINVNDKESQDYKEKFMEEKNEKEMYEKDKEAEIKEYMYEEVKKPIEEYTYTSDNDDEDLDVKCIIS